VNKSLYDKEIEFPSDKQKHMKICFKKAVGTDKNTEGYKRNQELQNKNFITRATLSEIQKQKAIKMVEDLLMKNKNSDNSEVGKKETEVSKILKKNISSLKKQAEKEGLSVSDLIKMLKSE
jgi:ribosomal protein L22